MAPDIQSRTLVVVAVAALVVCRVYARTRRLIRRQRLSARSWVSACLFALFLLALAAGTLAHPATLATLGIYALRHTRFEHTEAGLFYRPSAPLGVALSLLFTARIAYRLVRLSPLNAVPAATAGARSASALGSSPITLAIFGMLAGYHTTYAIGLLRWGRRFRPGAAGGSSQSLTK